MFEVNRENQIIATINYIHLKLGFKEPPFSFKRFFDEFPGYQVIAAKLPPGYDGELLRRGKEKIIRYRSESRDPSSRFTIAHEIAHSFLHHRENYCCRVCREFRIYQPPAVKPRELEADFFALELIAPLPMLDRFAPDLEKLSQDEFNRAANQLAHLFGINAITMKSRLKDLAIYRRWDEAEWL